MGLMPDALQMPSDCLADLANTEEEDPRSATSCADSFSERVAQHCVSCCAPPSLLSPLDKPGTSTRAWGMGEECALCDELRGYLLASGVSQEVKDKVRAMWGKYLTAMVSLRLEGKTISAWQEVEDRHRVLMLASSMQVIPNRPIQHPHPSSGSSLASSSLSCARHIAALGPSLNATPRQVGRAGSAKSDATFSPSSVVSGGGASPATPGCGGIDNEGNKLGKGSATSDKSAGSGSSSKVGAKPSVRAPEGGSELVEVSQMSVDAAFPSGQLGTSLKRIRATINEYVSKMCSPRWYETFRTGTIKALERRLANHSAKVACEMHLDTITAFRQLSARIAALLALHKALLQWGASRVDSHLLNLLPHRAVLVPFLQFTNQELADDLSIVFAKAFFHSKALADEGTIHTAFNSLDIAALNAAFDRLAAEPPKVDDEVKEEEEEHPEENEPGISKVGEKSGKHGATSRKAPSKSTPVLVREASATEAIVKLTDGALQFKLHALPKKKSDEFSASVASLVADLTLLLQSWQDAFAQDEKAGAMMTVLSAIKTVLNCCLTEDAAKRVPSDARNARHDIQHAASGEKMLKCAAAMLTYDGPKIAMEEARVFGAVGLHDDAADAKFDMVMTKIEELLALAFDDLVEFTLRGCKGKPFDLTSFDGVLSLARTSIVDATLCVEQWSVSRIEEKTDSFVGFLQYILVLTEFGSWLSLDMLMAFMLGLRHLLQQGRPRPSKEKPRVGDSEGGGQHHSVVDASSSPSVAVKLEDEQESLDKRVLLSSLKGVQQEAMTARSAVTNCLQSCLARSCEIKVLADKAHTKLGEKFLEDASNCLHETTRMAHLGKTCLESVLGATAYISHVADLVASAPFDSAALGDSKDTTKHMQILSPFCKLHSKFSNYDTNAFQWSEPFLELAKNLELVPSLLAFKAEFGDQVYSEHVQPTVSSMVDSLHKAIVDVHSVPAALIIKREDVKGIFGLLVVSPSSHELAKILGACEGMEVNSIIGALAHNHTFASLVDFVGTIEQKTLEADCIKHPEDKYGRALPAEVVLGVLGLLCHVRDVAVFAASLHEGLAQKDLETKSLTTTAMFETLPTLLHAIGVCLSKLDTMLHSVQVQRLESEGWRLPTDISVLKVWQGSMAAYRSRCIHLLLGFWVKYLTTQTKATTDVCPAWQVCFSKDVFKKSMAIEMVKNKLAPVIKAHNSLHKVLQDMNSAAKMINLSPKLATHEVTQQAVAIALDALGVAAKAGIFIEGVMLLNSYENSHLGAEKAKAYLERYKGPHREGIGAPFWKQFEVLVADGPTFQQASPMPSPCKSEAGASSAMGSATGAKSEGDNAEGSVVHKSLAKREGEFASRGIKKARR